MRRQLSLGGVGASVKTSVKAGRSSASGVRPQAAGRSGAGALGSCGMHKCMPTAARVGVPHSGFLSSGDRARECRPREARSEGAYPPAPPPAYHDADGDAYHDSSYTASDKLENVKSRTLSGGM